MKLHGRSFGTLVLCVLVSSSSAQAINTLSLSDLSQMASSDIQSLIQTIAIGTDHRAYLAPDKILLDVGIETTYIPFPSFFKSALALATSVSGSALPAGVLLPKLNTHIGLPFGFSVGASGMRLVFGSTTLFSSYGGHLEWALRIPMIVNVAARASYSTDTLYFLTTHTYAIDAVASKPLKIISPFVGTGIQFWSGNLEIPLNIPQLPGSISSSASGVNPRVYAGVTTTLLVARFTAQAEYSAAGIATYGAKLGFGF